jgi:hypothetical protein
MHGFEETTPATETIDHYELLCRVARNRGWKVLLHSDHLGGRSHGDELASQLTCLEVTSGGSMIARVTLLLPDRLPEVALTVLQRMKKAGLLSK